jgi:citrate lyase beta subunit
MSLVDESTVEIEALRLASESFAARYTGEPSGRQPVHTVYAGARSFEAGSARRWGDAALETMAQYARGAGELARAVGLRDEALAAAVYGRVQAKLEREPIEDFRIDFEDGFGVHSEAEEDRIAAAAARELGRAIAAGVSPPFSGIRIKSLGESTARAGKTLEIFVGALLEERQGALPEGFVVTLPKVNVPEQPQTLVRWLERLEARHRLPPGSMRFEMMVETTQALIGADGRSPLPSLLDACEGRCTGVHLGVYDFTASCGIAGAHQSMGHPMCELARNLMKLACGGRGVRLSDGSTNVLPVGPHRASGLTDTQRTENRAAVHEAWRLSYAHIRHSLEGGFYQGWDLHPAQLPVRYAASFAFFRESFGVAAERLRRFTGQAGEGAAAIADEPATFAALTSYVKRALACGAVDADELEAAGLPRRFGAEASL